MDLLSGLAATLGLMEGLPGTLLSMKTLRGGSRSDSPDRALACAAYLAFESAGARVLFHLNFIVGIGVPPRIAGGLWTWPAVYRSHRVLVESMSDMLVAFGQMVMLGDYEVNEAAYRFGAALANASRDLPVVGGRITSTPEFEKKMDDARVAMRDFLLAGRGYLAVPGKTGPDLRAGEAEPEEHVPGT